MRFELMRHWDYAYECTSLLIQHVNGDSTAGYAASFCDRHGVPLAQVKPLFVEIEDVERHVLAAVDTTDAAVRKYFRALRAETGVCAAGLMLSPSPGQDIQSHIRDLLAQAPRQRLRWLIQIIFGYLQTRIVSEEEKDAMGTVQELLRAIFAEDIADEDKLLLAEMCVSTDTILRALAGLYDRAIGAFRQAEHLLAARLQQALAHLETLIDRPGLTVGDFTEGLINAQDNPDGVVHLYPTAMGSYSRSYSLSFDLEESLYYGINVAALKGLIKEHSSAATHAPEILRLLGDATKQDILRQLRARRMYGQELAAALNLSTATISYHMNLLIQQRMVAAERDNSRVYYRLNEEGLLRALESIRRFLGVE